MKIFKHAMVVIACVAGALVPAAASVASTAPAPGASQIAQLVREHHAISGYEFAGHVQLNGEFQCLTALQRHAGASVSFHQCLPHDPAQEWDAFAIVFHVNPAVLHLELSGGAGTAKNPDLCLGGVAGPNETLLLINCNHDVPIPQSTFVSGSFTKMYAVNKISNQIRQYVGAPQRGRTPYWYGRFLPLKINRSWVFGMAFFGEVGWVQVNAT